ncbi:type II toxin-antitoxin system MqsR family toxin [Candidatus Bipolaricaulota bacterium]|nr:type II toxin-antitoxin system MqsR family toxin [Candidatus Bipolaricaulota bacterium]
MAVVAFLTRFKTLASKHGLVVFMRTNYKDTLAKLGILPSQAEDAILSLTISDYYKNVGTAERDGEEICEFGIPLLDEEIYIKLIVDTVHEKAICCSFHIAEREISYPFADDVG